ncbi:ABC transporter ATP-binding protein [Sinomonas sp. G460-2]|uniref:ABC transporter ATP-binding protein n=1 Tax=Sinomonas sp. G460-2 TaxID=3393464 RepID=UPI0039EFBEC1
MLKVAGITAGYGAGDVLQGVDFSLDAGAIGCIVGPNGAGKSTVLSAISGLLRPRAGQILLEGEPIHGQDPAAIVAAGVSQVPQANGLFANLTVRENVLMGAWVIRRNSRLVRQRLAEVEGLFPMVGERCSERAGNLSGGQRRQVEFARALMLRPRLVLLDEPTLGLDPKNLTMLSESIHAVRDSGATVLLVEQQVKFGLRIATHGIVMDRGRVVMAATAEAVLNNPDMARMYFGGSPAAAASPGSRKREDVESTQ